jgi:hypothetical protein
MVRVWLCPVPARTPGLIWVRDRSVGDGMVDGSIRRGSCRPLGLPWVAACGREPCDMRERAGSFGAIGDGWDLGAGPGPGRIAQSLTGSSAAGPSSRRVW